MSGPKCFLPWWRQCFEVRAASFDVTPSLWLWNIHMTALPRSRQRLLVLLWCFVIQYLLMIGWVGGHRRVRLFVVSLLGSSSLYNLNCHCGLWKSTNAALCNLVRVFLFIIPEGWSHSIDGASNGSYLHCNPHNGSQNNKLITPYYWDTIRQDLGNSWFSCLIPHQCQLIWHPLCPRVVGLYLLPLGMSGAYVEWSWQLQLKACTIWELVVAPHWDKTNQQLLMEDVSGSCWEEKVSK